MRSILGNPQIFTQYWLIFDNIGKYLQYFAILFNILHLRAIPNYPQQYFNSLLLGLTSLAVSKLFCDPDKQIPRRASYRGALAPKNIFGQKNKFGQKSMKKHWNL